MNKNNTSGYTGVCYDTRLVRYKAYYNIAGEKICLGYFSTPEDANNKRSEFKLKIKSSPAPIITFLCYKHPGLSEDRARELTTLAAISYLKTNVGQMFFSFCNKFVEKNKDATLPDYQGIFSKITNNPLATKVFLQGVSLTTLRKSNHIQFDTLINNLVVVVGE